VHCLRALQILMILAIFFSAGSICANSMALHYYDEGVQLAALGKLAEAKDSFHQALQIDPENNPVRRCLSVLEDVKEKRIKEQTAVHLFRAFFSFNRFRTDEAIQDLNSAIKLDPQYALSYSHRGDARRDKGEFDGALADYDKALEIDPKYTTAYINRGILYTKRSQWDRAVADFNRALELEPRNVSAYYSRGNTYGDQGRYEQAIEDYDRIVEIAPHFPHAYVKKGLAYEKTGRPKEALASYKNYLQKVELADQDPRQVEWVQGKVKSLEQKP
jgi:tetratricopeptide (TPR) repeat protein